METTRWHCPCLSIFISGSAKPMLHLWLYVLFSSRSGLFLQLCWTICSTMACSTMACSTMACSTMAKRTASLIHIGCVQQGKCSNQGFSAEYDNQRNNCIFISSQVIPWRFETNNERDCNSSYFYRSGDFVCVTRFEIICTTNCTSVIWSSNQWYFSYWLNKWGITNLSFSRHEYDRLWNTN